MKILDKPITELIPYDNNPRVNDDAIVPVAESIRSFGWKQPIVVDKNNVIVCGHTRYQAAKHLKLETVPCVVADDLTEDEIKAYRLIDNRSGEFSTWHDELLKTELESIDHDFDAWKFLDLTALTAIPSTVAAIDAPDVREVNYKEKFGVVVDCKDESEQRKAYECVTGAGFNARIVSI